MEKKQSYNICVQDNDLCLTSLILLRFTHTQYAHWHTWSGGLADVGTFELWDESCYIGTDCCFILPLQTPANITLHTNTLHSPKGDKGEEASGLTNKFKNENLKGKKKQKTGTFQYSKSFYSSLFCYSCLHVTIKIKLRCLASCVL